MAALRHNICVSIGGIGYEEILSTLKLVPFAEIRLDLLTLKPCEQNRIFSSHKNLIATYRVTKGDYDRQIELLMQAIDSGAAWVDMEIETPESVLDSIFTKARANHCKTIISHHNFEATPPLVELHQIADKSKRYQPNVIKIACMANNQGDCSRMLSLYQENSNLVAFCMGKIGTITRVAAPLLGAPFTYAGLPGIEIAPGQLDYIKLNEILNTIPQ